MLLLKFLWLLDNYTLLASTISTTDASLVSSESKALPLSQEELVESHTSSTSTSTDASGINAFATTAIDRLSLTDSSSVISESAASPTSDRLVPINHYSTPDIYNIYKDLGKSYSFKSLVSMLEAHNMDVQNVLSLHMSKSLFEAAKVGNLRVIRYLVESKNAKIKPDMVYIAARRGHYTPVRYLLSRCTANVEYTKALVNAIKSRNHMLIEFLFKIVKKDQSILSRMKFWSFMDSDLEKQFLVTALMYSRICSILQDWLETNGKYSEDYKWFLSGVEKLDLRRVDQDRHTFEVLNSDSLTKYQVEKSMNYLLLRILMDHKFYSSQDISLLAPKAYRQAILKFADHKYLRYLINFKNLKPGKDFLDDAAKYGNLELVRYLIEKMGAEPDYHTAFSAVCSLNVDICRYLFYCRKMIDDDASLVLFDEILSNLREDESFVDPLSEEEIQNTLKSALKSGNSKNSNKKVGFKETNQYYIVSRYLQKPRQISHSKKFSVMILSCIVNYFFIMKILIPGLEDSYHSVFQVKEKIQGLITGLQKSKTMKEMNEIFKEDFLVKHE